MDAVPAEEWKCTFSMAGHLMLETHAARGVPLMLDFIGHTDARCGSRPPSAQPPDSPTHL
jgi:hypothetical protein